MIAKITKVYTRHYRDNGQTTTYAEWIDSRGVAGRTEGALNNPHMQAFIQRAKREGAPITRETW